MLIVIDDRCTYTADRTRGVIVLRSDVEGPPFTQAFTELDSMDARNMACTHGSQNGLGTAHINGNIIGPYPVNAEGLSLENIRDGQGNPLPQTHPRMQPKWYQADIPVARPLR